MLRFAHPGGAIISLCTSRSLWQDIVDQSQFWHIIESTKPFGEYTIEAHYDRLLEHVCGLTETELLEFARIFHQQLERANTWEISDAAYVINTGCGDDSFEDFKAGLVAQGEKVFEATLACPEFLAQYPYAMQLIRAESILYLPSTAYEMMEHRRQPGSNSQAIPEEIGPHGITEPSGSSVGEDPNALRNRFPKLFKTFWRLAE